jgi:hypothetical protein
MDAQDATGDLALLPGYEIFVHLQPEDLVGNGGVAKFDAAEDARQSLLFRAL